MGISEYIISCQNRLDDILDRDVKYDLNEVELLLFDINNIIEDKNIKDSEKIELIKEIIWD